MHKFDIDEHSSDEEMLRPDQEHNEFTMIKDPNLMLSQLGLKKSSSTQDSKLPVPVRVRKHTTQENDSGQKKEFEFEREAGFSPLRDTSEPEFF